MLKLWNRLALAALLLPLTAFAATAVTVDIDIVSKGDVVYVIANNNGSSSW